MNCPTRITRNTSINIDHILTNVKNTIFQSGIMNTCFYKKTFIRKCASKTSKP